MLKQLSHHHLDGCLAGDNAVIPLLEIRVLGEFSIAIPGGEILRNKDLSISFRQLIAMLIAAPHQQLSQEKIQAQLWPDSTAERSRSKFDTLLMRLRKTLEGYLAGREVKSYLYLQKSVLCLDCCRIDAIEFESLARLGIKHARRMELWQADLVFRRAFRLWHGELNLGISLDENSDFYRQDLFLHYLDAAQRWTELLLKARRYETAVDMSRQALKYEPTHDHLIRLNRSACLALGLHGQASQLLKDYAEALRLDGHDSEEISDILRSIESGVSS